VCGDAKAIINQMKGASRVSAPRVWPMYRRACGLANQLNIAEWRWLPRKQNKNADILARRAFREIRANREEFENT
jgi:ribonuclease HI